MTMAAMFADQWVSRVQRERKRVQARFVTYKSLVYMNPKTGAMVRTCPMIVRRKWEFDHLIAAVRAVGYIPCYATTVKLHE